MGADLLAHLPGPDPDDGAHPAAGDPDDDDGVHPHHHRAVDPAPGPRHGHHPVESDPDGACAVHDFFRHGDDPRPILFGRHQAVPGRTARRRTGHRADGSTAEEIHDGAGSGYRSAVIHQTLGQAAVRDSRRRAADGTDPDLHHQRIEDGVSDRLHGVHSLSGHRPGGRQRADVDGHDDAVAGIGLSAVQDHAVRGGGRVDAADGTLAASFHQ